MMIHYFELIQVLIRYADIRIKKQSRRKIIQQILRGRSDANIAFSDLVSLLKSFGFDLRIKGSHHIIRKQDIEEMPNLQKDGNKAKPYQVKQVRDLIVKYQLGDK